jgi:signal peptidase I
VVVDGVFFHPDPDSDVAVPPSRIVKRVAAIGGDVVPPSIPEREIVVPQGFVVLIGDNLAASTDSRVYGFVSASLITGVVMRKLRT